MQRCAKGHEQRWGDKLGSKNVRFGCCVESLKANCEEDLEKELGPRVRTFLGRVMGF